MEAQAVEAQVLREQAAAARDELRRFDRDARDRRRELERAAARAEAAAARAEAAEQREAARLEDGLDPHKQAGPSNIARMRTVFERLGRASAADATREAGYPVGHQVWAIRALVEDGVIRETGETVNRSKVYEVVARRRTRVRPGQRAA